MRQPLRSYRFGDFLLDCGAHALLQEGRRLPVQEQPYQVLLALLEKPGQVVTREDLRLRLWGTDTFVDFDQSLNSAVRRLRQVLGDDSRKPIYVETMPRVGFRFLLPVTAAPALFPGGVPHETVGALSPALPSAESLRVDLERRLYPRAAFVACVALLLGFVLGLTATRWRGAQQRTGEGAHGLIEARREMPISGNGPELRLVSEREMVPTPAKK